MPRSEEPTRSSGPASDLPGRVERTFAVARLLTETEEDAARLVLAAFERMNDVETRDSRYSEDARLLRLVLAAAGSETASASGFDRRQAKAALDRLFPVALAGLSRDERLALYLTEVEQLSPADLAVTLGTSRDEVAEITDEARATIWEGMIDAASANEASLLVSALPDSWLASALRNSLKDEAAPPDSLFRAVAQLARRRKRTARTENQLQPVDRPGFAQFALPVLLIIATGLVGYAAASLVERESPGNLLTLTARAVAETSPQITPASAATAADFIRDQIGRYARIPVIEGAEFLGAGIIQLSSSDRLPVLYYDDAANSGRIEITVFDYDAIGRLAETVSLPPDLLRALETEDALFVGESGRDAVGAWRHRGDVYVASGPGESVRSLEQRVSFGQSALD